MISRSGEGGRQGVQKEEERKGRWEGRDLRGTITTPQRFYSSKRIAHTPTFLDINRDMGFKDNQDGSLLSALVSLPRASGTLTYLILVLVTFPFHILLFW
jgi:hypothetical protein